MSQMSRIKAIADAEISDLTKKIEELPRGGMSKLSIMTGVHKASVSRLKNGRAINSVDFKKIEVAMKLIQSEAA